MLKNLQIKMIVIFMLLGIVCITTLGVFFINKIELTLATVGVSDVSQIGVLEKQINDIKILIVYANVIFIIISIVVGYFVSKVIINPISDLIKTAEKIVRGEDVEVKTLTDGKTNNEIDELVGAFSIMTSELKEKLNETATQKRQIETILLKMTDGVIAFDIRGHVLHINHAAKKMLLISDEVADFEEIFSNIKLEINLEKIIYLDNWTSYDQNINVNEKYLNMMFAPFKDDNGRPEGVIVVIQDITEHVRLDNMRTEFVANVSHELKTPITSIIGYAETIQEMRDDEKEDKDKFLQVIISEAKRMSVLVTDLLALSKYDTGENTNKEEFDLTEVVKRVFDNLTLEAKKKNQDVECFVTANVPLVYADKFGIERVIINILNNSIKYTPENGSIKVYVGFVYNDAYIKVIDTGIGIPEEDLDRIFERFYRVDKARSWESGGSGLGLAIAKKILEENNSTISIKSIVDKGTEVVIKIPTVQERNISNG